MKFRHALLLIPVLALSACGQSTITKEELKTVATTIQTNNSSEGWVAPTKLKLTQTSEFKYSDPEEEMISDMSGVAAFDLSTGYFYYKMTSSDGTTTETTGIYCYVDGSDFIIAIEEDGDKGYSKIACSDNAAAIEAATANLSSQTFASMIALLQSKVAGLSELQSVLGFIEQLEVNSDSDSTNDITNGYTDYNLTFNASSSNETSFDVKFELAGSASETVEGVTYGGSINGVMEVTFVNGLLTHYLDNSTLTETMTMDGETMTMEVVSNGVVDIDYNASEIHPDLTDFSENQQD